MMHQLHFNPNAQDAAAVHVKYRAYIDGLRAIAVLAVLLFHADLGVTGGYVGVDVFFVISGFLITGLILKDLDTDRFSIVRFWERRIRRIMPALAVVVLVTLVAGYFLLLPQGFKELGESVSAQALLGSNVYFWIKSWIGAGYFAPAAEVKPLLHTWSLAVEEQFYLLFPFLLLALKRFARNSLVPAIVLVGGISFGLSVYSSYRYPSVNFYFLHTRAWELLLGAFLAAQPANPRAPVRWLAEMSSWGGLLMILFAVISYDRATRFPGVTAILPCVGTVLIIWANSHKLTAVGKGLSLRPVVFIGLISYSLYLWHWPVFVFAKYWAIDPIPREQRLLLLLASLVLAVLSWRFVETPFRQRVLFKSRAQIFLFAVCTTAVLLLAGFAIHKLQGVPARIPEYVLKYAGKESRSTWYHDLSLQQAVAGDFTELGLDDKNLPIKLLVWGDSHAMAVIPAVESLCKENLVRGVAATHLANAPLVGYVGTNSFSLKEESVSFNSNVVKFSLSNRISDVILACSWDAIRTDQLRATLVATVNAFYGSGTRIWILKQVPRQRWSVHDKLAPAALHGFDPESIGLPLGEYRKEFQSQNRIFEEVASKFPNVTILDPSVYFVNSNKLCRVAKDGVALYSDDNHLTVAGAMLLRPLFEPVFQGIRKE